LPDELTELWDAAIYKEIAAQAAYEAAQQRTEDPAVRDMLQELAVAEQQHSRWLKDLKETGDVGLHGHHQELADLGISQYLAGGDTLEGAGLQETLSHAIKREQQAVDFYSRMMGVLSNEAAQKLCHMLTDAELGHKMRLETLYDDLFYAED